MSLVRKFLPAALLLGSIAPVFGADQYDIELLVFSYQQVYGGGEQWRLESTQPSSQLGNLSDDKTAELHLLPAASWQLKGSDARLRDSSQYDVLWHARWRQPATSEVESTAVNIYSNGTEQSGPLSGWAQFYRGRYPHLGLDLILQPPTGQSSSPLDESYNFHLTETRRLKSGQIHYYDHPAFGALVIVTPTK